MKLFRKIVLVGLACLSIGALSIFAVGCGQGPQEPHVHNYFRVVEDRPANCQEGGYTVMGCDCGDMIVQNETPPTDHKYEQSFTQPPTATEGGFTEYRCFWCGDSFIGDETGPLGITVYFDAFNGAMFSQTVGVGEKLTKPNDPIRAGYEFNYWRDPYDNEWNFEEGTAYEGLSLRAYYTAIKYDIIYNLNGGIEEQNPLSYTAEHVFTLNTPTKRGYEFLGWTGTDLDAPTMQVKIKDDYGDREYVANWRACTYTITFDTLGNGEVEPKQVEFDSTYGTLPTLQKDHYTFNGWYTSSTGGVKVEETTAIDFTANKILYARLTPISYNITYTLDGGYASGNPKNYDVEDNFTLVNPTRTGYNFLGWTGTDLTEPSFEVVINHVGGDREYTANWQAKTITVKFDTQGGSAVSSKQVKYDSLYGELPTTEKDGYVFDGWLNHIDDKITSESKVTVINDTTLYAKWTSLVKYELNNDGESYSATGLNISHTDVVILDTYENKPITSVVGFNKNYDITSVVFGANVQSVLASAFQNCTALASVSLNSNLKTINAYAFDGCTALSEIDIPEGVINIGYGAFSGCTLLEQVDIPDSVQVIGTYLFANCTSLHTVNIGDGIIEIADYAFV